jgi:hypothetical protein
MSPVFEVALTNANRTAAVQFSRAVRSLIDSTFTAASGAGLASNGFDTTPAWATQSCRKEVWYQLGLRTLEGFASTAIGKALFSMGHTWDARRMLIHMARVLQTGINLARARLRELHNGDV